MGFQPPGPGQAAICCLLAPEPQVIRQSSQSGRRQVGRPVRVFASPTLWGRLLPAPWASDLGAGRAGVSASGSRVETLRRKQEEWKPRVIRSDPGGGPGERTSRQNRAASSLSPETKRIISGTCSAPICSETRGDPPTCPALGLPPSRPPNAELNVR